jgi:hypothetical protein
MWFNVYLLRLFALIWNFKRFKLFRCTCEKRVTGKQPSGRMLAVYRIRMTKCVTSPPLLACTDTLLWKIGNQESAPFLNALLYWKIYRSRMSARRRYLPVKLWNFTGQWPVIGTYFEACWLHVDSSWSIFFVGQKLRMPPESRVAIFEAPFDDFSNSVFISP